MPVGLWVERSAGMIVALLGILKSGAAYLPIDAETPAERLARLLAAAQAGAPPRLLVTTSGLLAGLPAGRAPEGVCAVLLDAERRPIACGDGEPASGASPALPENLAYILYTSGSTGFPKGVAVTHRSAVAYTRAIAERYGLGLGDRALQFASLSFDASVEEIFTALATGAALVVRTEIDDPDRFLARCREQRLTHLSVPTAYWHQLAAALDDGATGRADPPPDLRLVVIGGERALAESWARWGRERGGLQPAIRLFNAYGPTEATIAATLHEHAGAADAGLAAKGRAVPIGRPLPGVSAQVLDRELRPVAIGAVGELCLGGVGLARGYLGRPDLTAAAFVPDPREMGTRIYRSGDFVRLLADGRLEFAGRADAQVKVRGFRIELGEIEAALAAHPAVRQAAAVAPEDASGNRRLIAFVVPREPSDPSTSPIDLDALGDFLAARLPAYMLPELAAAAALPLTAAGKVDRGALLREAATRARAERALVPPRNVLEERLVEMWRELLGVERVSVDDDFFALGGHSLMATRLASRLRRELGVELPLSRLFELRRLADLAQAILDQRFARGELDGMIDEIAELTDEEALGLVDQLAGEDGAAGAPPERAPGASPASSNEAAP